MNTESQILNVPIEDIIPNRFQPRLNFDETALKELADSIKEHGIIQPLVLRRLGDKYEIVAGERRYKASKLAGLTSVPAIITSIDDKKSAEVAIVENVQRKDLSSIEEAKSYKALLDKGYLTQEELAQKMGLSQSAISNKLRLLTLSSVVQNALMEGKISERHARSLLQVGSIEEQEKWLSRIIEERITVRELEKRLKEEKKDNSDDDSLIELTPNIEEIKNNATDIISSKDSYIKNNLDFEEYRPIIPNKFFNYLEDESVNMSVSEPNSKKESIEEVEMLDFLVPEPVPSINYKDMTIANNLIDNLSQELKNNKYNVNIVKDETTNELKYTIVINKNE